LAIIVACSFGYAFVHTGSSLRILVTEWPLILLLAAITVFGIYRKVKVYDALIEGGKIAFDIALRIIPFLVAILVAVGMLRASGAIDMMAGLLTPLTNLIGMPAEALPMALLRPLSGSGSLGVASEIMKTHGPDSMIGYITSTIYGSSETTFYVLAVYFGAVQVRNGRHTLITCLTADFIGVLCAVWSCRILL
jgi:spore maturation protein B